VRDSGKKWWRCGLARVGIWVWERERSCYVTGVCAKVKDMRKVAVDILFNFSAIDITSS
jgi:hypothetical protein